MNTLRRIVRPAATATPPAPLRSSPSATETKKQRYVFDLFADACFCVDICLNFRTAYRQHGGETVTDPVMIRNKYLLSWFPIDIVASFPLSLLLIALNGGRAGASGAGSPSSSANKLVRMLRFAKLSKLVRVLKMVRAPPLQPA